MYVKVRSHTRLDPSVDEPSTQIIRVKLLKLIYQNIAKKINKFTGRCGLG